MVISGVIVARQAPNNEYTIVKLEILIIVRGNTSSLKLHLLTQNLVIYSFIVKFHPQNQTNQRT